MYSGSSDIGSLYHALKPVIRAVSFGAAALLVLALLLLTLSLSREPAFAPHATDHQDVLTRTRMLLRNSVPRERQAVVRKVVAFTATDLESVANYALSRRKVEGYAEVAIRDNRLRMQASVKLPWHNAGLFLNIRIIADDGKPNLVVRQLKLGRVAVPHPVVGWLLQGMMRFGPAAKYAHIAREVVREVRIVDDRVRVDFDWNRKALAQADDLVTDFAMKERMLAYHRRLAEVVRHPDIKKYVRLTSLTQALFALARTRSDDDREPIEENRALILTLSAYVNGRDLAAAFGVAEPEFNAPYRLALLSRRVDTAQHFVTSAALVVSGTRTLADVVGLAKELNDTHSGTGFSFTDLAADRAGANFGKLAVSSETAARRLQQRLAQSADESLFMPSIKDLPENIASEEFVQRFKSVDSPEFGEVRRVIEERIANCPIYQH